MNCFRLYYPLYKHIPITTRCGYRDVFIKSRTSYVYTSQTNKHGWRVYHWRSAVVKKWIHHRDTAVIGDSKNIKNTLCYHHYHRIYHHVNYLINIIICSDTWVSHYDLCQLIKWIFSILQLIISYTYLTFNYYIYIYI